MSKAILEVYVLQGGRWEYHTQFPAAQRNDALNEAKIVEGSGGIGGVKVMRIATDGSGIGSSETIIYKTPGLSADEGLGGMMRPEGESLVAPSRSSAPAPSAASGGGSKSPKTKSTGKKARPAAASTTANTKPRVRNGSGIRKIIMLSLFSLALSAAITGLAAAFLRNTSFFGTAMVGDARGNTLFAIFIGCFLFVLIPSAIATLTKEDLEDTLEPDRPRRRWMNKNDPDEEDGEFDLSKFEGPEDGVKESADEDGDAKPNEDDETEPQNDETGDVEITDVAEAAKAAAMAAEASANPVGGKDGDKGKLGPFNTEKNHLMKFLSEALTHVEGGRRSMDNYNKFAVNMFLAGAVEIQAKAHDLDDKMLARILGEGVSVMGFKQDRADAFADKYEEYMLADKRYMVMFAAGRDSMQMLLDGNPAASDELGNALKIFNAPKVAEEASTEPVTVLFTDIVGSTNLAQTEGDAAAQPVVRTHNQIVRAALKSFNGSEVKHTGDGIMASFTKTTDSVEAAIKIQKDVVASNKLEDDDLPLILKIGINVGEPIAEGNDLFGTTVQLAARIVDQASDGQIYISEIVRGICAGKSFTIESRGAFDLKGFDPGMNLYEVMWNDGETQAAAPAPAAEPDAAPAVEVKPVADKPVTEPAPKPATETVSEPVAKPVAEPVATPTAQPVAKPAATPTTKPAATPAAQPVVEPAAQPVAEPAAAAPAPKEDDTPPDPSA